MRTLPSWVWIAAALCFHLILWFWVGYWRYGLDDTTVDSVLIAVAANAMTCLCAWGAFGPGGIFLSTPSALSGAILIWLAAIYFASRDWIDGGLVLSLMMISQCAVLVPVVVLLRTISGERFRLMEVAEQGELSGEEWGRQISLQQIMGWTAIAAGLCWLSAQVCGQLSWEESFSPGTGVVALIGVFNSVVGLSQLIPFFLPAPRLAQWAISVFAWFAVCLIEVFVFDSLVPRYGGGIDELNSQIIVATFLMNTPHLAGIWVTFALLYLGGLRQVPNDSAAAGQSAGNGGR